MPNFTSLRGIDLNLLVVLDAIAREGTLTGAGRRLGLTQPAVSHALGRLRDLLDDRLFVRDGGRMLATPFARDLIGDVRRSMAILEERLFQASAFDPALSTATFRVALPQTHEAAILTPLCARLASEAAGVTLHSVRADRRELEAELSSGRIDVAVDLGAPVGLDVLRLPLFSDRLVVALRGGHPLLRDGVTLDGYLATGHILVSSRRQGGGVVDVELTRMGLRRSVALRCQSTRAAVAVAARSDLLLTLAEKQLAGLLGAGGLTYAELPFPTPVFEPKLYWHSGMDSDPANRWLRGAITDLFGAAVQGGDDLPRSP